MLVEEVLVEKANENNVPISVNLELSPVCNFDCNMCNVRLRKSEAERIAPITDWEKWAALGDELFEAGTIFILLTGGEPLLYPNFTKLYTALRKKGFILTLNTNGALIDGEIAECIAKNKPRRVNVTLYGASNETYGRLCHDDKGFDKTMNGIRLLKEMGVDVKLNGTIVKENIHELDRIFEISEEIELPIEVDTYMFPFYRCHGREYDYSSRLSAKDAAEVRLKSLKFEKGDEAFAEYTQMVLEQLEKGKTDEEGNMGIICRAGRSSAWVNWAGYLQPCFSLENIKANVFELGFKESYRIINEACAKAVIYEGCRQCEYRFMCSKCGGRIYAENGDMITKPEYLCEYTKEYANIILNK